MTSPPEQLKNFLKRKPIELPFIFLTSIRGSDTIVPFFYLFLLIGQAIIKEQTFGYGGYARWLQRKLWRR